MRPCRIKEGLTKTLTPVDGTKAKNARLQKVTYKKLMF